MTGKQSPLLRPGRVPEAFDGIQVNYCKNPTCRNFGVPPPQKGTKGRLAAGAVPDSYRSGNTAGQVAILSCKLCSEHPTVKSNRAVAEELKRLEMELDLPSPPCCDTDGCPNQQHPITSREHYQRFGKTASGSTRYRCKACLQVVSFSASPVKRQREASKNRMIFSLLMNKSPMRRICEVADIHPKTLYQRIGFFYEQCRRFAASRELQFFDEAFRRHRAYVSVDRQDYLVNWSNQNDRRNVKLHAVASADHRSGYVFGVHLDFDPSLDAAIIEQAHAAQPELHISHPFRRYARIWLLADYRDAIRTLRRGKAGYGQRGTQAILGGTGVISDVEATYNEVALRDDVERSSLPDSDTQLG